MSGAVPTSDEELGELTTDLPGRSTLRDVAKAAGVSIKTASRVVNNERHVKAETGARVLRAIELLDYRPNEIARNLKAQRSRTVALMIADVSNPFYALCAKAVEEVARENGYTVILTASAESPDLERQYVELLIRRRVEGLLVVPAAGDHQYLVRTGVPIVALDRPIDGLETDCVLVENQVGTRDAVSHLIADGHRHIAFIGAGGQLYTSQQRLLGYLEAIAEAQLDPMVVLDRPDAAAAAQAVRELLAADPRPDAIFCMNNLIVVGALEAAEEAGLAIPDDLAIAGFDDVELARLLRPRLSLVSQPADQLGRVAATFLFERLDAPEGARLPPRRVVLPVDFQIRESCGRH